MSRRASRLLSKADEKDPLAIDGSSVDDEWGAGEGSSRLRRRQSTVNYREEEADDAEDHTSRRRSVRHRSPNKRYTKDFVQPSLQKKVRSPEKSAEEEGMADDDEECPVDELAAKVSATNLFEERIDVEGQRIFGFKTPRKRDSMNVLLSSVQRTPTTTAGTPKGGSKTIKKLLATPKTPRTPKTPAGRGKTVVLPAKTPRTVRSKLKKNIKKLVQHESGSDFSASESDFVPSSEEDEDDDGESDEDEDSSSGDEQTSRPMRPMESKVPRPAISIAFTPGKATVPTTPGVRRSSRRRANLEYVPQCEDYFTTHGASKVVTSDHTLDRLNTPRLPHDQLFRLLKELRGSSKHDQAIQELHAEYEGYFSKWLFLMNEGFNVLLYGLGSKRNLLQAFHRKVLANQPVLVVNGFFPSLNVKDVLDAIANDILDLGVNSANLHEVVDLIEEEFSYLPSTHLFLIVHNLDGTVLRNGKTQNVLARLASIANVHLLASIDHINTPLMWDSCKLARYNFSWWDVTTMLPYTDETAFENSLLVQNSGALALSSMRNVFHSLTANSRGIFLVIVRYQLKHGGRGNAHYAGMLFKDLYWSCREAFLVSTDLALRAQLTEFIDHKLVRVKRTADGAENLLIPIEHALLQQFVEENDGGGGGK